MKFLPNFRVKTSYLLALLCVSISLFFIIKNNNEPKDYAHSSQKSLPKNTAKEDFYFTEDTPNEKTKRFEQRQNTIAKDCQGRGDCEKKNFNEQEIKKSPDGEAESQKNSTIFEPKEDFDKPEVKEPNGLDAIKLEAQKRTAKENQAKFLVAIDGKYSGTIDITDQEYREETNISKLRCSISIDSSNIANDDINSAIFLYKIGEQKPYFRLNFSGDSIYQKLQLLNNSKFSIASDELEHKFELDYSAKTKTITGKLFVVSGPNRDWIPVGTVNLTKIP